MPSPPFPPNFNWPLAYEAEDLVLRHLQAFLCRNSQADHLARSLPLETGTEFIDWVDHLVVAVEHRAEFLAAGFEPDCAAAPSHMHALWHPHALLPRVLVDQEVGSWPAPRVVAIRTESLADFAAQQRLTTAPKGSADSRYQVLTISGEFDCSFQAVERLGYSGYLEQVLEPGFGAAAQAVRDLWRTRRRDSADDGEGMKEAFEIQEQACALVGPDVACDLFFAEERRFWELRNGAARMQKYRQDRLGLGWANHDHHTFRSSRRHFPDLIRFMENLGLAKRERFYAGAEAGWGAQVLESLETGVVVFADVDLLPDEVDGDFTAQSLPEAPALGTVGLWCALHGDSLLQAGMHHLEARFNFNLVRHQSNLGGIGTMKPFSDFAFLQQAFTEGERWAVDSRRLRSLLDRGLITATQAAGFARDGAIGSHLEHLQRGGGFKGFNQKSVSAIIAVTDPRKVQENARA